MEKKQITALLLATFLALGGMGANCDGTSASDAFTRASSECKAGMAQLLIMDGLSKRLCGCNEGSNLLIPPGQPLVCTVAAGTKIFFHFQGQSVRHQIISVGTPGFPSSPIYNPMDRAAIQTHVVTVTDTSSPYNYRDQYNSQIFGQIVAQ